MKINRTLTLVLKTHWFKQVAQGKKRVEYRVMNDHWAKRIWEGHETFTHVRFMRGYQKHGALTFPITNIDIGPCPYEGWPGDFYRIHFEDIPNAAHP